MSKPELLYKTGLSALANRLKICTIENFENTSCHRLPRNASKEIKNTNWNVRWQYLLIIRMLPSDAYDRNQIVLFQAGIFRYTYEFYRGVHWILRMANGIDRKQKFKGCQKVNNNSTTAWHRCEIGSLGLDSNLYARAVHFHVRCWPCWLTTKVELFFVTKTAKSHECTR